ncbi:hypothetical protein AA103196_2989 [Ameyamaea chiangmaiensis NBRC 103196]|nr:hypothetical protein AA103196_2989 [Ameyamaea chiangmaiensis NBRC 103196]
MAISNEMIAAAVVLTANSSDAGDGAYSHARPDGRAIQADTADCTAVARRDRDD